MFTPTRQIFIAMIALRMFGIKKTSRLMRISQLVHILKVAAKQTLRNTILLTYTAPVFSSIFVEGEEESLLEETLYNLALIVFVLFAGYMIYWRSTKNALRQAGVAQLDVIRREEEYQSGRTELDFDEWQDDGSDVQKGKFNIVEIAIDEQEEVK